jgi:hypothetical protein
LGVESLPFSKLKRKFWVEFWPPIPGRIMEDDVDEKEKDEWRKAFTASTNKENPNKLTEIIRRVNQLIEERKKGLAAEEEDRGL